MVTDSIASSIPSTPKDVNKKKRAHRSAKLKQCKLDARREQWLSQVGAVKKGGGKEESAVRRGLGQACGNEGKNGLGNLVTRQNEEIGNEVVHNDFELDSLSNSPMGSSLLGGNDSGTNFTASSRSSTSGSSIGGYCSGNVTEEEEEGGGDGEDDNCLDDWEAVADALAADADKSNNNKQEGQNGNLCSDPDSSPLREGTVQVGCNSNNIGRCQENSRQGSAKNMASSQAAPMNFRAWRPDDALRPQCLPNLSKQRSFPNTDRHYGQGGVAWGRGSAAAPSSCPICFEDLDFTDTSFLPCLCGFRLCLFCHKRILEEDGRCPGCRKPYEHDPAKAEPSVHGCNHTFKLARSCSMIAR